MKKLSGCFLILLFVTCANVYGQQKLNFTPLADADTSLAPIETAFNGKLDAVKVVGLGEATHGDKTTFAFNFNMVKYLVAQRGFRILLIEAPNSVLVPLNNFIQNDSDYTQASIDTLVIRTIPVGAYRDRQTAALLKWLKDYNLGHPAQKVQLLGMSLDVKPNTQLLNDYIKRYDPQSAHVITTKWENKNYKSMNKWNDVFNWQDEHTQLIATLDDTTKKKLLYDFNNSKQTLEFYLDVDYQFIKQNKDGSNIIFVHGQQDTVPADNFYVKLRNNPAYKINGPKNRTMQLSAIRDSLMAVYVVQGAGNEKAIVWAHNDHVMKPETADTYLLMGDHLNSMLGKQYYTIITNYSQGGSIRAFGKSMTIKKAQNPMDGQTVVKILNKKFDYGSGIAFSADLSTISKYNAVMNTAGLEGTFGLETVPWSSFDALAIVGALQPRDLIQ